MSRYSGATWRGPVPNVGGAMSGYRLFVVHIQEGTEAGTDAWFHNPAAQVSAHFGVPKFGELDQWVDTAQVAWAEAHYNSVSVSAENEGKSGESLNANQVEHLAQLLAWCHTEHGIPLQITTDPNGRGVIGHGQLGVAGGNHPDCPGQPIIDQFPAIVARAAAILSPPPVLENNMARLFDVSPGPAGQAPGIWAAVEGVGYVHVAGPAELAAYRAGGTPEGTISYGQHLLNLAATAPTALQLSDAQVASMAATIGAAITAKLPTHITGTETTTVSETLV